MKAIATDQKLRGGYYTPKPIADFLTEWAIQSESANVLEPSCGDGEILASAASILRAHNLNRPLTGQEEANQGPQGAMQGVEIDPAEAEKAYNRLVGIVGIGGSSYIPQVDIHNGDFFAYCQKCLEDGTKFDAIVGNPPFIRYQNFAEEHRTAAFKIMHRAGLHPTRLTNAWVPFLVASTLLLREHGRIAMVIPAELLQVNYAAELRLFLSSHYSNLTLVTFKKLVFEGIQQEVVLLLGEQNGDAHTGIRTIELDDIQALASFQHTDFSPVGLKPLYHSTEKWTRYFLDGVEIELLRRLEEHGSIKSSGSYIDVDVGIVTGLNEFFVLTQEQVKTRKLAPYTVPLVGRSGHLPGVMFTEKDWKANVESNYPAFLLVLPDVPFASLADEVKEYVLDGEARELNKGYKCRIRKNWFTVPSVWTPSAFMLRQVHMYPKIVVNEAGATCTDTIHRVKLLNGKKAPAIATAFLNSLTFAFTEVMGRSYGGGVLELEPSEAENLPLPVNGVEKLDLPYINKLLMDDKIDKVLEETDRVLLIEGLGLSVQDVTMLRTIWLKLRNRRVNRK